MHGLQLPLWYMELTVAVFKKEVELLQKQGFNTVEDITGYMNKKTRPMGPVFKERLKVFEKAIKDKQKLEITYVSFWSHDVTERTIMPKKILKETDRVYIVADCLLKNEQRNFRLDGVLKVNKI